MKLRRHEIVICICGLSGSGKSSIAKRIATKYGLEYFSGGDALRKIARKLGFKPEDAGWWDSKEGFEFTKLRVEDGRFDKMVDEWLLEKARKGRVVLDSRTMPWLFDGGFKIWLDASKEVRAMRVAKRDGISVEEALKIVDERDKESNRIYEKLYGFKVGEDLTPFHLIVDTDNLSEEEVLNVICAVIDSMLERGE